MKSSKMQSVLKVAQQIKRSQTSRSKTSAMEEQTLLV